jgi:hypothetical protein
MWRGSGGTGTRSPWALEHVQLALVVVRHPHSAPPPLLPQRAGAQPSCRTTTRANCTWGCAVVSGLLVCPGACWPSPPLAMAAAGEGTAKVFAGYGPPSATYHAAAKGVRAQGGKRRAVSVERQRRAGKQTTVLVRVSKRYVSLAIASLMLYSTGSSASGTCD